MGMHAAAKSHMESALSDVADILIMDLRALVRALGAGGGLMSASVYDTARVASLAPPDQGTGPALDWLLSQQQSDGGWGEASVPIARDVPTLAAILALHSKGGHVCHRAALDGALAFLRGHARRWRSGPGDDLPVGFELILPRLLDESVEAGLEIPREDYATVMELGQRRLRMIAGVPVRAGSILAHSWESLEAEFDTAVVDGTGGVGHNPAATAAWIHRGRGRPGVDVALARARRYLSLAAEATGVDVPGVVPTAWPITRFEQAFGLHALLSAGLLHHPSIQDVLAPQIEEVTRALRDAGVGFTDEFEPDGDDTAAAMAVLHEVGRPAELRIIRRFAEGDRFAAYVGELQSSPSVTARAAQVLELSGEDCARQRQYLVSQQLSDGRWVGDKWNGSWLYATLQVLLVLRGAEYQISRERAVSTLLDKQHPDGGWGAGIEATLEETAYAILALSTADASPPDAVIRAATARGGRWLLDHYRPFHRSSKRLWVAKEAYRPERISKMFELTAMISALHAVRAM
jgi:hypothetical protein